LQILQINSKLNALVYYGIKCSYANETRKDYFAVVGESLEGDVTEVLQLADEIAAVRN
jgi:hypothetical protein